MAIGMISLVDLMINYFVFIDDFDDVEDEEGDADIHRKMESAFCVTPIFFIKSIYKNCNNGSIDYSSVNFCVRKLCQ
jgi:hypothetical protein